MHHVQTWGKPSLPSWRAINHHGDQSDLLYISQTCFTALSWAASSGPALGHVQLNAISNVSCFFISVISVMCSAELNSPPAAIGTVSAARRFFSGTAKLVWPLGRIVLLTLWYPGLGGVELNRHGDSAVTQGLKGAVGGLEAAWVTHFECKRGHGCSC